MEPIESLEYRQNARRNCYRYGPLYLHSKAMDTALAEYAFPQYEKNTDTGSIEKLMSLLSSLRGAVNSVDASEKLAKPLPGAQWGNDSFEWDFDLSGRMYTLSYKDYRSILDSITREVKAQGWKIYTGTVGGLPAQSYIPNRSASDALYNEDPVDAASRAMLTSATGRLVDQAKIFASRITGDVQMYAEAVARNEATGGDGGISNVVATVKDAYRAIAANLNAGTAGKWMHAGYPVELIIDGQSYRAAVNAMMTSLSVTEGGFVVDSTSGSTVYPTYLDIKLHVKNLYGKLATSSTTA